MIAMNTTIRIIYKNHQSCESLKDTQFRNQRKITSDGAENQISDHLLMTRFESQSRAPFAKLTCSRTM